MVSELVSCKVYPLYQSQTDPAVTRVLSCLDMISCNCCFAGCLAMPHMAHMLCAVVMCIVFGGMTLLMVSAPSLNNKDIGLLYIQPCLLHP